MARSKRTPSLGVDWHLPARRGDGYARRPFATTTVASSDLIRLLADDGLTWAEVADAILFDPDAKHVATTFVDAGHGDTKAALMVA